MSSDEESPPIPGQRLSLFATQHRCNFPVLAEVVDFEESTLLKNHQVDTGARLVIHGWTRQTKVVAKSQQDKFYAIPLTYQGSFQARPQHFLGVSNLEEATPEKPLKVTAVNVLPFPLNVGDILRVSKEAKHQHEDFYDQKLKCERFVSNSWKEVELPYASDAYFEEVLEGPRLEEYGIKEILKVTADTDYGVVVTKCSLDQQKPELDLTQGEVLTLVEIFMEPAVYVSKGNPNMPAFHMSLRTPLSLTLKKQLPRSVSPLITKHRPRLSTLDRCVEILSPEAFSNLTSTRSEDDTNTKHIGLEDKAQYQKWKPITAFHTEYTHDRTDSRTSSVDWLNPNSPTKPSLEPSTRNHSSTSNRIYSLQHGQRTASQSSIPDSVFSHVEADYTMYRRRSSGVFSASPTSPPPGDCLTLDTYVPARAAPRRSTDSQDMTSPDYRLSTSRVSSPSPHQQNHFFHVPPGYALVPVARQDIVSSEYSILPVTGQRHRCTTQSIISSPGEDDESDEKSSVFTLSDPPPFQVHIPPDGNLYHLSVQQFCDVLRHLHIDERSIRACKQHKVNGKKFSKFQQPQLQQLGLVDPVIVHFRQMTRKKQNKTDDFTL